jgi:hypothetical protein
MGMFDDKKYLTGDNGEFKEGDEFHLHSAEIVGEIVVKNEKRTEAKLVVNKPGEDRMTVYTSGRGIVGSVERIEPGDLPAKVRLTSRQTPNGNMYLLAKAEA